MQSIFGIDPQDVLPISAKTGLGVQDVLKAIIDRIPPPVGNSSEPLKAFLFDSSFVPFIPSPTSFDSQVATVMIVIVVSFHSSACNRELYAKVRPSEWKNFP